jgi:putative peptidoglycan lipid II flippase
VGSVLQFGVQLPTVLRLLGRIHFQFETVSSNVRTVIRNFVPGVAGRGVNQVSSYIDEIIASFLPAGSIAALGYAQTIYILPVSLFGMSISSAELPEMASQTESGESAAGALRSRLNEAVRRVSFFVVPSAAALFVLGDSIVAFLYRTGRFTQDDVRFVWFVLAGYAVGLLAATAGRLYASAHWAMRDTRTPFRFAAVRVVLAAGLGWLLAFPAPHILGIPGRMGLVGLTLASGLAAWVEFTLLRSSMNSRIGKTGPDFPFLLRLSTAAIGAAALAFLIKHVVTGLSPLISGAAVLSVYGFAYFAAAAVLGIPHARKIVQGVSHRFHRLHRNL